MGGQRVEAGAAQAHLCAGWADCPPAARLVREVAFAESALCKAAPFSGRCKPGPRGWPPLQADSAWVGGAKPWWVGSHRGSTEQAVHSSSSSTQLLSWRGEHQPSVGAHPQQCYQCVLCQGEQARAPPGRTCSALSPDLGPCSLCPMDHPPFHSEFPEGSLNEPQNSYFPIPNRDYSLKE